MHYSASMFTISGQSLHAVQFDAKYVIGAQVASLLKRETFNMYRSLKIKKISIRRASPQEVSFLVKCEAVRVGTHSVTLIPHDEGLFFIADALQKLRKCPSNCPCCTVMGKKKQPKSYLAARPRLHRRKPLPWDLHRSLKPSDVGTTRRVTRIPASPSSALSRALADLAAPSPTASGSKAEALSPLSSSAEDLMDLMDHSDASSSDADIFDMCNSLVGNQDALDAETCSRSLTEFCSARLPPVIVGRQ